MGQTVAEVSLSNHVGIGSNEQDFAGKAESSLVSSDSGRLEFVQRRHFSGSDDRRGCSSRMPLTYCGAADARSVCDS